MLIKLPCGHSFHASPTLDLSSHFVQVNVPRASTRFCPILVNDAEQPPLELPDYAFHNSRKLKRMPVDSVSYGAMMNCDLCARIVPNVDGNVVYHSSTPLPGDLGGYDICIQCYLEEAHSAKFSCRGIRHWLSKNPSCPVCRAPADK
jgi:hypothetical protein